MAIILDFQGREFNTQHDIVVFIRECVNEAKTRDAKAFATELRHALPETADDTIAFLAGWAFPEDVNKVRHAIRMFGVKSKLFGEDGPREKTRGHWEKVAKHPHLEAAEEREKERKKKDEERVKEREKVVEDAAPLQDQIDAGIASALAVATAIAEPVVPPPPVVPTPPIVPTGPMVPTGPAGPPDKPAPGKDKTK